MRSTSRARSPRTCTTSAPQAPRVAIYKSRSDSTEETLYLHRDHLGSVTEISDETGAAVNVEHLSYDAWGKRRNGDWSDPTGQIFPSDTPRGFTGHEHLDDVGLVHMNGRVYDPDLGRMLSADPGVQFAGYSQSFNRYSYVLNNPLAFTDPSGFCIAGGMACPTSGFGGFTAGLGGLMGRAQGAIPNRTVSLQIGRSFSTLWACE